MRDIRFSCRVCGQKLAIDAAAAGWEIRCPKCGTSQTAPDPAPEPESNASSIEPEHHPAIPEFARPEPGEGGAFEYAAFISYRHLEPDRTHAKWLHTSLETYRVPEKLARERGLPERLKKIFRDEEELPASADLSKEIEQALRKSRFLVVVCSPRTPSSQWVNAEVEFFRSLGRNDQILALLIEGEPGESFPQALREIRRTVVEDGKARETLENVEPLAADVRPIRKEKQRHLQHMARLRILATILGIPFDALRQRDREREKKRRTRLSILFATLALCIGGLLVAVIYQWQVLGGVQMGTYGFSKGYLKETSPKWVDRSEQTRQQIAARRTAATEDLESFTPLELVMKAFPRMVNNSSKSSPRPGQPNWTGMPQQPPRADPSLPDKFIIQGILAAVRREENQVFVYLRSSRGPIEGFYSRSAAGPPRPLGTMPGGSMLTTGSDTDKPASLLCVVFEGPNIVRNMADYQVGQTVSVAVQRRRWVAPNNSPNSRPASGRYTPGNAGYSTVNTDNPYWPEFCRFGAQSDLFWCFGGDGIEKSGEPASWIDPGMGRSSQIVNDEAVNRSLGTVLRDCGMRAGAHGLMDARFAGLLPRSALLLQMQLDVKPQKTFMPVQPKDSDPVLVLLTVSGTVEGSITFVADMGSSSKASDFKNYSLDEIVGVEVTTVETLNPEYTSLDAFWPLPDPSMPAMLLRPSQSSTHSGNSTVSQNNAKKLFYTHLPFDPLASPLLAKCKSIKIKRLPVTDAPISPDK